MDDLDRPPRRPLHVVMFPWLAFGHMIPYLELSKSLAMRGHRISFLSTPRNIPRLPPIPPAIAHLIDLIPLPLPPMAELPPGAEATIDLSPDQAHYFKKAADGLAASFAGFLESTSPRPDWILFDFHAYWAPPMASKLGVPCVYFTTFPASIHAFLGSPSRLEAASNRVTAEQLTAVPDWISFSASKLYYRLHEARDMAYFYYDDASGVAASHRLAMAVRGSRFVVIRSCVEFESEWLGVLRSIYEKPVVPVGLLPPPAAEVHEEGYSDFGDAKISEFLQKQAPKSVEYVAFGTEATLSDEFLHELALGIELSGIPFIWALRKPLVLLEGFEQRMEGRGVVAMKWVPQLKILAHGAVGGFMTHCGWNSVIEGIGFGHPLVLLPVFGDQFFTARLLEERKVGVEVARREEDGWFSREAVPAALRSVMGGGEGEVMRANARELGEVFGDKELHDRYVDEFVQCLRDQR